MAHCTRLKSEASERNTCKSTDTTFKPPQDHTWHQEPCNSHAYALPINNASIPPGQKMTDNHVVKYNFVPWRTQNIHFMPWSHWHDRPAPVASALNMVLPSSANSKSALVGSDRPIFQHSLQMELRSDSSETECGRATLTLSCAPL